MARFAGTVGFSLTGSLVNGVWKETGGERPYKGDILNDTISYQQDEKVNDDVRLSQRISINSDRFAMQNYHLIRYVVFKDMPGTLWEVTSVTIERPRLILSLGGVYDGTRKTDPAPTDP
jgi:hypothetical protein